MGRHGLQLDQVRFTMHPHALIKAEETRQGPDLLEHRLVTNIIQFFNHDRCLSRMPQRCRAFDSCFAWRGVFEMHQDQHRLGACY